MYLFVCSYMRRFARFGNLYNLYVQFVQFVQEKRRRKNDTFIVKLQAETCNYAKSNTPPRVFYTFVKLYK